MGTIVALPGANVPLTPFTPDLDVVEVLERALARAKAGEIHAVALAIVDVTGTGPGTFYHWAWGSQMRNHLLAAVMRLSAAIVKTAFND